MVIILILLSKTENYIYPCCKFISKRQSKIVKLLRKGFERSAYWNGYETKSENENKTKEYRYFLEWNFVGFNRLFVLVHSNQDENAKRFKAKRYYLPKGNIYYYVIINGKNFDQPIHSDIKRYEEIRKLTTGQGEDYTTGCLLDYVSLKNHYRLIAVDLSKQSESDADPKAIQQELVWQLKEMNNNNNNNNNNVKSMFVLTIFKKSKKQD